MSDNTFHGWVGLDKDSVNGKLVEMDYQVKPFEDTDIDIEISHCGMCASDLHMLRSGWGPTNYPIVVGHEIVGKVIRKGASVTGLEIGDRVGVGAQSSSCLKCYMCTHDNEQYCPDVVSTYGMSYPDGSPAMGGYGKKHRVPAAFAFKLPDSIPSEIVAPMMCGGLTMYSPLKRYGAGPTKTVGIVGIGGLGHFGLLFAKALGCKKIVAISRSRSKEADARKMGATDFIATGEEGWAGKNVHSIDLIISTANDVNIPMSDYLMLLTIGGYMVQVGVPEGPLPNFNTFPLIVSNAHLTGTGIGSRQDMRDMIKLVSELQIKSWIVPRPMSDVNQVLVDMENGKARYRYVLCN
ncbi:chaperonin 10-like protein [Lipomyces arxii]|uniref:chaperonin 10-like protein n=1 Tax=Lipomyces arxii TaxID=56418 RepID=UPI0034CDC076